MRYYFILLAILSITFSCQKKSEKNMDDSVSAEFIDNGNIRIHNHTKKKVRLESNEIIKPNESLDVVSSDNRIIYTIGKHNQQDTLVLLK